jgi:hypothetical protein
MCVREGGQVCSYLALKVAFYVRLLLWKVQLYMSFDHLFVYVPACLPACLLSISIPTMG